MGEALSEKASWGRARLTGPQRAKRMRALQAAMSRPPSSPEGGQSWAMASAHGCRLSRIGGHRVRGQRGADGSTMFTCRC